MLQLLFLLENMCMTVTESLDLRLCAFISLLLSLSLSGSQTLLFFSLSSLLPSPPPFPLCSSNLFSLFCKLGVLVRHRISLFGKDVHASCFHLCSFSAVVL